MHSINKKNSIELLYSLLILLFVCCLERIESTKAGSFSSSVVKISSTNNNNNKQANANMYKSSSRDSTDEKSKSRQYQDQELPDEQRLLEFLLDNYDPASRPVFNASDSVEVKFGFSLVQLYDMDERNQILTTNVWLEQVLSGVHDQLISFLLIFSRFEGVDRRALEMERKRVQQLGQSAHTMQSHLVARHRTLQLG
jgi:hypothetical protein